MRIFGYGSLLSEQSLKQTVPNATGLEFGFVHGYRRLFNMRSPYRKDENEVYSSVLTLEPYDSQILGLSFVVQDAEAAALLERERGYAKEPVMVHTAKGERIDAFTFIANSETDYYFVRGSSAQLEYLDICLEGAHNHSKLAVQNFLHTTFIDKRTTVYEYITQEPTLCTRYSKFITK